MNKTKILNVPINTKNYLQTLKKIKSFIDEKQKAYVCVAAVHLIMECQKNYDLAAGVRNADLITPDGMPLVWISRLYGDNKGKAKSEKGANKTERVYGPNLTLMLCGLAQQFEYKVFLLGGSEGQSKKLTQELVKKYPGLKIVGAIDTPIRPIPSSENIRIIKKLNASKADIVLVGLGCPNQELWMIENRAKLSSPVIVGVGAAFDFITGKVKQAPVWMQNSGFEWLFRLVQEPRRLFWRYCILNTLFVLKISKQVIADLFSGKL